MTAGPIRVLLIDDHAIFRQGVRLILQETPDIAVVGEAATGEEGLALYNALGQAIDVVVTDLILPDFDGLEVLRRVKARRADARVVLLTMYSDDEHIRGMVEAGADGYVLKQVAVKELIEAIRLVHRGETALTPLVAQRLMTQVQRERAHGPSRSVEQLSARERQILRLLATGLTSKEIARELRLSANTIDNHRSRILDKLGVSNTAAAIRLAARQGVIPATEDK